MTVAVEAHRDVLDRHRLADDRVVHRAPHDLARCGGRLARSCHVDSRRPSGRPGPARPGSAGCSAASGPARPCCGSSPARSGWERRPGPPAAGRRRRGRRAPTTTRAAAGGARARRARGRCGARPARPASAPLRPSGGRRHRHRHRRRAPAGPREPAGDGRPGARSTPTAASRARRSSARSATWSRRWASDAVVSGTPRAAKRASSGSAGYCSPAGLRHPADESSAAMPVAAAASAMRSHHSPGAVGTAPGHLDQVGVGEHVAGSGGRQLLHGLGVGVPAVVDRRGPTTRPSRRVVEVVEAPGPHPVHRAEQHVERVAGEQVGHLVHPARGSSRPRAPARPAGPARLASSDGLHVGVEIGPGVEVPVAGHRGAQRGRRLVVLPEPAEHARRPGRTGRGAR